MITADRVIENPTVMADKGRCVNSRQREEAQGQAGLGMDDKITLKIKDF